MDPAGAPVANEILDVHKTPAELLLIGHDRFISTLLNSPITLIASSASNKLSNDGHISHYLTLSYMRKL